VNKNRWSLKKYADGQQNDQSQPLPIYRQFAPSLAGGARPPRGGGGGGGGGGFKTQNCTSVLLRLVRLFQNPCDSPSFFAIL